MVGVEETAATTAAGESFRAPVTSRAVSEAPARAWRRERSEESPTTAVQSRRVISVQKIGRESTSLRASIEMRCTRE